MDYLLLESGDYLLQEDGVSRLILEVAAVLGYPTYDRGNWRRTYATGSDVRTYDRGTPDRTFGG